MYTFDLSDHDRIANLIDNRLPDAFVMPLYIRIYNTKYDIRDINNITDFNPVGFKIGFGAFNSLFSKTSFPSQFIFDFDDVNSFNIFKEDINTNVRYITFESTDVDRTDHPIFEQINYYFNLFKDYLTNKHESYRKSLIEETMNS